MKFNIFSGARRIALLVAAIWVVGILLDTGDWKIMFTGLVIWIGVVVAIGWIVRGFLGIPWPKDTAPAQDQDQR